MIPVTASRDVPAYIAIAITRWRSSTARSDDGSPSDRKNSIMRFAFALIIGLVTVGAAQAQTFADRPSTPRELSTTYLDTSTPSFSRSHAQQYNTANGQ
ncbi:hypothetical protein [Plastoroseomonas hellenica]|uniref:hypothetical protein n=1 Tax=Plastoroseomonas hellenica TaxID=2687306 RepID=UPI001BAD53D4|nr:hypothetical protein [Plastoroseomonas hellenica]MBR0646742.1 hypothetical protein [Plastoroseomonas hellenica]